MVITFLPYSDFKKSAKVLDYQRLGKMRSESYIILKKIEDENSSKGYINHPMVKMWKGYSDALKYYHNCVIEEWVSRGYNNSLPLLKIPPIENIVFPKFIGLHIFHYSHQASLLRKHPFYYSKIFTELPSAYTTLGYYWPSNFSREIEDFLLQHNNDLTIVNDPPEDLFAEINQDYLISSEKSEMIMYTKKELIEKLNKNQNLKINKNSTKKEIFDFLKSIDKLN